MDMPELNPLQDTVSFLKQPFRAEMDPISWILFVVFIVSVAYLWTHVLRHMLPE